jgi:hypothetical protein
MTRAMHLLLSLLLVLSAVPLTEAAAPPPADRIAPQAVGSLSLMRPPVPAADHERPRMASMRDVPWPPVPAAGYIGQDVADTPSQGLTEALAEWRDPEPFSSEPISA